MKPAPSKLKNAGIYQGPSWNPTRRKSGCGHGLGELPKILEFPFNISAKAEASDFKFGVPLGFAKGRHKITPWEKIGYGPGVGKLPKIWGFLYNISATAEASDFKFGMLL